MLGMGSKQLGIPMILTPMLGTFCLWSGKGFVVLPLIGDPVLILGAGLQPHAAQKVSWLEDICADADILDEVTQTIQSLGLAQGKIGLAGMGKPMLYADVLRLLRQLPKATVVDATAAVDDVMAVILAVGIDDKILLESYPKEFYHLCQS